MMAKSGINNGYNQRSVVWDSKTPFCRNTMSILVRISLSSTHSRNTKRQYIQPLSITYSNFIPFKHRLINPFLCCTIKFLMQFLYTTIDTPICCPELSKLLSTTSRLYHLSVIKFLLKSMKWGKNKTQFNYVKLIALCM